MKHKNERNNDNISNPSNPRHNPKYSQKYEYKGSDNTLRADNERNELLSQLVFEIKDLNSLIREYMFLKNKD